MAEMTPGDRRLLEAMTRRAIEEYGRNGMTHPFGAVETEAGVAIYTTNGLPDIESKRSLMNAMRLASYDMQGSRSALCFEGWTVIASTPEAKAQTDAIKSAGRSIREHPDALDALHVMVESEDGCTTRIIALTRSTEGINLVPTGDRYQPGPNRNQGDLTGYHVTSEMRRDARFRRYIEMVRLVSKGVPEGQSAH